MSASYNQTIGRAKLNISIISCKLEYIDIMVDSMSLGFPSGGIRRITKIVQSPQEALVAPVELPRHIPRLGRKGSKDFTVHSLDSY
jgi:hypothetical protein